MLVGVLVAWAIAKDIEESRKMRQQKDEGGNSVVRPDIVVHVRGNDARNLLVLELKKRQDSDCNRERIRAFREQFDYTFGATIVCAIGDAGKIRRSRWFDERNPDGI
jgi:hypothetical protein